MGVYVGQLCDVSTQTCSVVSEFARKRRVRTKSMNVTTSQEIACKNTASLKVKHKTLARFFSKFVSVGFYSIIQYFYLLLVEKFA